MKGKSFWIWVSVIVVAGAALFAVRVLREKDESKKPGAGSVEWNLEEAAAQLKSLRERLKTGDEAPSKLVDDYRRLVERFPKFATARAEYAMILYEVPNWEEAYEQIELALEMDPQQAAWHLVAGTIASNLQLIDEAAAHYNEAVALAPDVADYRVHQAQTMLLRKQYDKALLTLLEALKHDSENHTAYGMLADLYAKQNKISLALQHVQKAIDHTPPDLRPVQAAYVQQKAALLRRDNRPKEALQVLNNELLSDDHLRVDVLNDLAVTWMMLGKPAKGAEAYEQALDLVPADERYAIGAALWRIKAGDLPAARQHIDTVRRINPRHGALEELESRMKAAMATKQTQ